MPTVMLVYIPLRWKLYGLSYVSFCNFFVVVKHRRCRGNNRWQSGMLCYLYFNMIVVLLIVISNYSSSASGSNSDLVFFKKLHVSLLKVANCVVWRNHADTTHWPQFSHWESLSGSWAWRWPWKGLVHPFYIFI
jgi:hypothetical protein